MQSVDRVEEVAVPWQSNLAAEGELDTWSQEPRPAPVDNIDSTAPYTEDVLRPEEVAVSDFL